MSTGVNFRLIEGDYSNEEDYEKFVEYYNQGMSYAELVKCMDSSINKLRRLLKEAVANGDVVPRRPKRGLLDNSIYYKFLELYSDEEWSVEEIKKELNINQYMFEKYRRQGVKDNLLPENRLQLFYNQRVAKYYNQVVSMLKQEKSIRSISIELDLPYASVQRMRRKAISEGDI